MRTALCVAALLGLCAPPAGSQTVGLSGILGSKALVIVGGSPPKVSAPGETFCGMKIISTQGDQAIVDILGKQHTLRVGDAPASVGGQRLDGSGTRIVLTSSGKGHFVTLGQIKGRSAESTANGVIPAWLVKLKSVKFGEVTLRKIDAFVTSGSIPYVLLGNSFLTRVQMTRTNDQLVLDKRY